MSPLSHTSTQTHITHSPHHTPLLITILLLTFAFRAFHLSTYAFNGDEAFSIVNWTTTDIPTILSATAIIDPQPPLAILAFRLWVSLVGTSEPATRSLSLLASIVTATAVFTTAKTLAPHLTTTTPLLATLLFALSPLAIWHAQDIRPYSLWLMSSTLSTLTLLLTLRKPNKKGRWLALVVLTTATLYLYYLELFFILARALYVLNALRQHHTTPRPWLVATATILLLTSPWYSQILPHISEYHPTATQPTILPTIVELLFGYHFPTIPSLRLLTIQFPSLTFILALLTLTITVIVFLRQPTRFQHQLPALLLVVPLSALIFLTIATQQDYFRTRYILPILTPLIILISTATTPPPQSHSNRTHPFPLFLLSLITIPNLISLAHYYFDINTAKSPPWHAITNQLTTQTTNTDLILYNYPDPAVEYYLPETPTVILMPPTYPADPVAIAANLTALTQTHTYIYFLPVYSHWDPNNQIQTWLNSNTQFISQQYINNTLLLQYSTWQPSQQHITHTLSLPISDIATLTGYRLTPPHPAWLPGTTLYLEIFWHPLHNTPAPLTIFTHLIGPLATTPYILQTQEDSPPQDAHVSTTSWTSRTLIRDVYILTFPPTLPAGTYAIVIGFYNTTSLQRAPTTNPLLNQAEPNSTTLLTFTVTPP